MVRSLKILGLALVSWSVFTVVGQEPATKAKVPDEVALTRSRELIREIFAQDLKQAATPEARLRLAGVFATQARENKDEPANRFVLLEEAQHQAGMGGDVHLALTLLDELARDFNIDPLDRKARLLADAATASPTPEAARSVVDLVLPLIVDAVEADQFVAARQLGTIAQTAAIKVKDEALTRLVERRLAETIAVEEGFRKLQGAIDRLKADPKDPQANLDLGRYYALLKNRWEKALPLLAHGQDDDVKVLARQDLSRPKTAAEQAALGDAWWERSLDEKDPARFALQTRAAFWYEQALPGLAGLHRTKASKRLDRVAVLRSGSTNESPAGPLGELKKFEGHADEVKTVALSADGRFALSGSVDQTARVWDLLTGKEDKILKGHAKQLWSVGFHPNGRWGFTTSWDGTARLWDLRGGNEIRRFTHTLDVNGLAVSRNGDQLLTGCDNHNSYLWNTTTGEEVRRYTGHTGFVYGVAFAPDGRHLATSSVDKSIRVSDLATGNLVKALEGHTNPVTAIAFSPDSRSLFSCGDSLPRQWDIATGQVTRRFEGHTGYVLALALSPDGRRLVTGGDDRTIRLWDVATGKELHKMQGHEGPITSLAFSQDGRKVLSGSTDRTVRLWGLPSR